MVQLHRRDFVLKSLGSAFVGASSFASSAAGYPERAVKFVVGFPPGTGPDVVTRIVAQRVAEGLRQPVVVENTPGMGGLIAAQSVSRAAPDGYTLFLNTVSDMSIAPHIYSKLAYDPKDFALVTHLVYADVVLVIPASLPARDLQGYVAWAKQQKNFFMATFGPGSPAHFGLTIFGNTFSVKPEPIHYKSTGDAITGVLSGEVPGLFATPSLVAPFIKDGKLRALAATSPQRMPLLQDVPTFAELGYPQAVFASWFGVAAPKGTPGAHLDLLNAEFRKALQAPEVREQLESMGFRTSGTSREDFARIVQDETAMWGKVAKATGFKAD